MRNLTHLQISFPALYHISINALSHLTKLQTLDLSGNFHLSFDVVVDALRVTEFTNNLDELNLQSLASAIPSGELDETFFLTLQRLNIKRLDLSHAHYTKVDPNALSHLGPCLEVLLLLDADFTSYNFFSSDENFTKQMFANLQLSDMSFAKIPQIILSYNNENHVAVYDSFFPPFQAQTLKMSNVLSRTITQKNIMYKSRNCNREVRRRIEMKNNNIRLLNISLDPHMPIAIATRKASSNGFLPPELHSWTEKVTFVRCRKKYYTVKREHFEGHRESLRKNQNNSNRYPNSLIQRRNSFNHYNYLNLHLPEYRTEDPPNKHLVFLSFCNDDQDFVYRYILDELKDALSERLGASKDDIVCIGDIHFEPEEVDPKCMSKIMYKHFQRYTRVKWTRKGDAFELVPCWAKVFDSICTLAGEKARFAFTQDKVESIRLPTT
ncbi:hypothetical protein CHS0354_028768 [Potamilus streckersoni]|uniref:Uncharacterized protein n=1 Tax=Potamilus streckersoni TaxID=2493646 RepID=A0AAE0S8N2_9BIVA|nr:hypothetical protein CHS0354_028768 [Potamilus streckersoni]